MPYSNVIRCAAGLLGALIAAQSMARSVEYPTTAGTAVVTSVSTAQR